MKSRTTVAICALTLAAAGAWASPLEDPVDTAGLLGAVPLALGQHTLNAALADLLELDRYTVQLDGSSAMQLRLRTQTAGLDARVELRGPTGTLLQSASCDGSFGGFGVQCSLQLSTAVLAAGSYTLNLSDVGGDETGAYQMHLEQVPPGNNWLGMAYDTDTPGLLGHSADMDIYAFEVRAGTGVRLAARSTTAGLDPAFTVWRPDGTVLGNAQCDGSFGGFGVLCTAMLDLNAPAGIYHASLGDTGLDESGAYRLRLSCLFGNCPLATDPVPAVPEPQTWLLMALGLAGLAGRARRR